MKQQRTTTMDILPLLDKACGLDIHKDKIVGFIAYAEETCLIKYGGRISRFLLNGKGYNIINWHLKSKHGRQRNIIHLYRTGSRILPMSITG